MFGRIVAAASVAALLAGPALAQGNSESAPGQDRVCLVTFNAAATEQNVDVTGAKVLPRKAAEAQANDTSRIYEYGAGGALTVEACDCLNNPDTRASCDQPLRTD
jgi:hypothetical protein